MTYVVAFDNSRLAKAALDRACSFASTMNQEVVAVTAIPKNPSRARERGWLAKEEPFKVDTISRNLRDAVTTIDPDVRFEYSTIDRYAPKGRISRAIRELAVQNDAEVVFVGSENAGRLVGGITSVGQTVTADDRYDVHIVRHPDGH